MDDEFIVSLHDLWKGFFTESLQKVDLVFRRSGSQSLGRVMRVSLSPTSAQTKTYGSFDAHTLVQYGAEVETTLYLTSAKEPKHDHVRISCSA